MEGLLAAAPVVWLLANDFYDTHARLAVCAHNRLGRQCENLAFRVATDRVAWQAARQWVSAEDVFAWRTADRHERRQAGQWLLDLLSQGPLEAQQLWEEARECGLAERTIRRAAAELDLHPTKDGKSGVWLWGVRSPGDAPMAVATPEAPAVGVSGMQTEQNVAALPTVASRAAADVEGKSKVQSPRSKVQAPKSGHKMSRGDTLIGVGTADVMSAAPPSKPDWQISRIRLSG